MNRRVPELDGLRGAAILLVLVWHLLPGTLADAPPRVLHLTNSIIRFAWSGVDLFFVLSGFLIGGILIDHRESARYFKTFYARRFHRILPIYFVMVSVFILLLYSRRPEGLAWLFDRPMPLWSYLTLTQNIAMARAGAFGAQWLGPTWSLAIEEQFYLLLPPIIHFIPRRGLWLVLILMAAVAPATRLALFFADPHWAASGYMLMPARADALMLGVLAALMLRQPGIRARVLEKRKTVYGMLGVLSLVMVAMALTHETIASAGTVLYGFSILALFYTTVLVLAVTAREGEIIGRVLRASALRHTGTLAYGIYLMHLPVRGICALFVHSPALEGVVTLATTFALAGLSWKYFERPFVRRGHQYSY